MFQWFYLNPPSTFKLLHLPLLINLHPPTTTSTCLLIPSSSHSIPISHANFWRVYLTYPLHTSFWWVHLPTHRFIILLDARYMVRSFSSYFPLPIIHINHVFHISLHSSINSSDHYLTFRAKLLSTQTISSYGDERLVFHFLLVQLSSLPSYSTCNDNHTLQGLNQPRFPPK